MNRGLTAVELDAMKVGQFVVDGGGVEWVHDTVGRWESERGRLWSTALCIHWGPIRRAEEQVEQPMPTASAGPPMHRLAKDELDKRMTIGQQRYGQPLQAMNGRDAVRDTIEELADGLAYALQIREERRLLREELVDLARAGNDLYRVQNDLADIITRYFPEETS